MLMLFNQGCSHKQVYNLSFPPSDFDRVHHGHDPAEFRQQEAVHDGDVGHRSHDRHRVRAGDQDRLARRRRRQRISAAAGGRGRLQPAEAAPICKSGMLQGEWFTGENVLCAIKTIYLY